MSSHFLIEAYKAKYGALKSVYTPHLRLFLFEPEDTAGRGEPVPIDFGGPVAGEVTRGWRVERRRFDRDAQPLPLAVLIACKRPYLPELLRRARLFLIAIRGAPTGDLYQCEAAGVVSVQSEAAYRFAGDRNRDDFAVPGEPAPEPVLLESGYPLLLE